MSTSPLMIGRPDECRAGVIVPSDMALDAEMWRWAPDGVSLLFTRLQDAAPPVPGAPTDVEGDEGAVWQCIFGLRSAAPAAYAYAGTSGGFVNGPEGEKRLVETMRSAGGAEAVTTSGAMLSALMHLGLSRVAVVSPHDPRVTENLVTFLAEADVDVVSRAHLTITRDVWTVPYEQTLQLVRDADSDQAEAVFVSGVNLATYDVIANLEAELRKPVLTANQVTMWALLAAIGRQAVGPHQWLICGPPVRGDAG
jgi:maleate isomerase